MAKVSREEELTWTYFSDGSRVITPESIFLGELEITRGMIIEHEGNKGIIIDLHIYDESEFVAKVFWFSGPRSEKEETRTSQIDHDDLIPLLGHEWVD